MQSTTGVTSEHLQDVQAPEESQFYQTLAEFKDKLSQEQIDEFETCTLEDLHASVASIQEKQNADRKLKNMTRLARFVEAVNELSKVMEIFVNSSHFVAFIWGPMRFMLMAASTFRDSFNPLIDTYEQLGETLPMRREYEKLLQRRDVMVRILTNICKDILDVHHAALRRFSGKAWKHLYHATWKTFQRDFGLIIDKLEEHKADIHRHSSLAQFEERQRAQAFAEATFRSLLEDEESRRRIAVINWLNATGMMDIQARIADLRADHPETGQWLLRKLALRSWMDFRTRCSPLLWLNGIPGAGKTVLTSLVINTLQAKRQSIVVFFYFNLEDSRRNDFLSAAREILSQLTWNNGTTNEFLQDFMYESCSNSSSVALQSDKQAKALLEIALQAYEQVHVILDGLDECNSHEQTTIINNFRAIVDSHQRSGGDILRCLFISRHDEISDMLLSHVPTIQIEIADSTSDISIYVESRSRMIQDDFDLNEDQRKLMVRQIVTRAKGMFLFAFSMLENLRDQHEKTGLLAELHKDRLSEVHDRLSSIISTHRESIRESLLDMHPQAHPLQTLMLCSLCQKEFSGIDQLKRHHQATHEPKDFICQSRVTADFEGDDHVSWGCGRVFKRSDALRDHFETTAGRSCIAPLVNRLTPASATGFIRGDYWKRLQDWYPRLLEHWDLEQVAFGDLIAAYPKIFGGILSSTDKRRTLEQPNTKSQQDKFWDSLSSIDTHRTLEQSNMKSQQDETEDCESVVSDVFSEVTMPSSASSAYGEQLSTAIDELVKLLVSDGTLSEAFERCRQEKTIAAGEFETHLRRLLKKASRLIQDEAASGIQRAGARIISSKARQVAHFVTNAIFMLYTQPNLLHVIPSETNSVAESRKARLSSWLEVRYEGQTDVPIQTNQLDIEEVSSDSDEDEPVDTHHNEKEPTTLHNLQTFISESQGFNLLRDRMKEFAERPMRSRKRLIKLWEDETKMSIPFFFFICKPDDIAVVSQEQSSLFDRLRLAFENWTGEEWLWDPLPRPLGPLLPGRSRLKWETTSKYLSFKDVSPKLAKDIQDAVQSGLLHGCRTKAAALSSSGREDERPVIDRGGTQYNSSAREEIGRASATSASSVSTITRSVQDSELVASEPQPSLTPLDVIVDICKDVEAQKRGHILLTMPKSNNEDPAQVNVAVCPNDKAFFTHFRAKYRASRGFVRYWLSPKCFSHCCFVKVKKWYPREVSWLNNEVPERSDYEYQPRASTPYCEPIGELEWRKKFHCMVELKDRIDTLDAIPKRRNEFDLESDDVEILWGIRVHYKLNAWGTLAYFVLFIAAPVAFWPWWLRNHPGDWQTAVAPLTTIMAFLVLVLGLFRHDLKAAI